MHRLWRQPGRVGRPAHRVSSRIGSHPHGSDDGPIRCDGRLLQRDEVRAATARKLELRRLMRQAHLSHLAQELRSVADEVVQLVNVMDGLNRYRFMKDAELLAAWDAEARAGGHAAGRGRSSTGGVSGAGQVATRRARWSDARDRVTLSA